MLKYENLGNQIVELIGGEDNIQSLEHCATRLRFRLTNDNKANKDKIADLPKVLQVVEQGGAVSNSYWK